MGAKTNSVDFRGSRGGGGGGSRQYTGRAGAGRAMVASDGAMTAGGGTALSDTVKMRPNASGGGRREEHLLQVN